MLDVHALDRADAFREVEHLRLQNGGVVNQPRSRSHIDRRVEALLDRRPDREGRSEVVTRRPRGSRRRARRAHRSRRNSWSAAYRANTSDRPGSTPMPTRARTPRFVPVSAAAANCSSPSITPVLAYGSSGCGRDSDIAMSRYVVPVPSRRRRSGITNRGSQALSTASALAVRSSSATAAVSLASTRTALQPMVVDPIDDSAGATLVVVGDTISWRSHDAPRSLRRRSRHRLRRSSQRACPDSSVPTKIGRQDRGDAMTAVTDSQAPANKGLKSGALGLWSTVVVGVASTAPAYSLAATLGFIVFFARSTRRSSSSLPSSRCG